MAVVKNREFSYYSDENQALLDQIALSVYTDMGIIDLEQYDNVKGHVSAQINLLQSMRDLKDDEAIEFSERFIDKILDINESYLSLVPPSTLAKSYNGIKQRLNSEKLNDGKREYLQNNLDKITQRIDELINDFAQHIGYHFVDTTNISDVYAAYNEMFDAREQDLEENSELYMQIKYNRESLNNYVQEYDNVYNLNSLDENSKKASGLEEKWDKQLKRVNEVQITDSTLYSASHYKFLDENGDIIPQFIDESGEKVDYFMSGYELDKKGRLANVIDLARMDIAQKNLLSDAPDENIENDVNQEVLYKLFEIDTAEKIVHGATVDQNRFTDPQHFQKFINNLDATGGNISERGYESAMDAQVNKTAGWAGRIKQKLGKFSDKATGFFEKVFDPIKKIDKRAKDRIKGRSNAEKRQQRIEFFIRILKGFGSAFLISAAITTVATAAAAVSGVSVAVGVATVSVIIGIMASALQINKWRAEQRKAGKDDGIKALLSDKRMLTTLGTTAIASIAMVFGAAGLTSAAIPLGYGALALGGTNNTISTFKDAKTAGMSTTESAVWAIANALAVIGGGMAGRATANALINSYNNSHPDNKIFQKQENNQEWKKIGEHEESQTVYKQETLHNAERIAKMWYRDNPELLQHRVDMVNAYNAEHGTNINPYRAIIINADAGGITSDNMALHIDGGGVTHSGGQHTVLTPRWANEHGFSMDEINAMRHMFDGGQISESAINAANRADAMISPINEVGDVSGRPVHQDHVLKPLNVDLENGNTGYSTYVGGESPYTTITNVVEDFGWVDNPVLTPVDIQSGLGMFGTYNKRHTSGLKDRPGALADKIYNEYKPDDVDDIDDKPEIEEITVLPQEEVETILPNDEQNDIPEENLDNTNYIIGNLPAEEDKEQEFLPQNQGKIIFPWEKFQPKIILPEKKSTPAQPEYKIPLALPPHIEEKPQFEYQNITSDQAKKLKDLEHNINVTLGQLSKPNLSGGKRKKLNAELIRWKQDLNKLRKEINKQQNQEESQNNSNFVSPEYQEPLSQHIEQEPEQLYITPEQAKKMADLQHNIEVIQRKLSKPGLLPGEGKKLNAKLKRWKQDLNKLRKEFKNLPENTSTKIQKFRQGQLKIQQMEKRKKSGVGLSDFER